MLCKEFFPQNPFSPSFHEDLTFKTINVEMLGIVRVSEFCGNV